MSGTRHSIVMPKAMAMVRLRSPIRPQIAAFTTTKSNRIPMPSDARRRFGTRATTALAIRRPSRRAWGTNSSARNRIIVGIAAGAVVQRSVQVRKFCWNASARPMSRPPA